MLGKHDLSLPKVFAFRGLSVDCNQRMALGEKRSHLVLWLWRLPVIFPVCIMNAQQQGVVHHMHALQKPCVRLDLPHQPCVVRHAKLEPEIDIQILLTKTAYSAH